MSEFRFRNTWLPLDMAQRVAFNRDATTSQKNGFLEVHRRGEYLGGIPIADGAVRYRELKALLAVIIPTDLTRSNIRTTPGSDVTLDRLIANSQWMLRARRALEAVVVWDNQRSPVFPDELRQQVKDALK